MVQMGFGSGVMHSAELYMLVDKGGCNMATLGGTT
jgi:hypothetical protein